MPSDASHLHTRCLGPTCPFESSPDGKQSSPAAGCRSLLDQNCIAATRPSISPAVHDGTTGVAGPGTQTQEPSPMRGFQPESGQVASDVALQVTATPRQEFLTVYRALGRRGQLPSTLAHGPELPISSFFPFDSSPSYSSSIATTTSSWSSEDAGLDSVVSSLLQDPWPSIGSEILSILPALGPLLTPPVATLTPPRIPTVTQPAPQSATPSTTFPSFLPSSGRDDFRADSSSASSSDPTNYPSSATVTVTQTALDPSTPQAPAPTVTDFISITVSDSLTVTVTPPPSPGISSSEPFESPVFPSTTTVTLGAASAHAGERQRSSSSPGAGILAGKGIAVGVSMTVLLVCAAVALFWYLRCYQRRRRVRHVDPFTVHRRALARLSGSGSSNGGSESDSDRDCDSEKVSYGTEEELAESDGSFVAQVSTLSTTPLGSNTPTPDFARTLTPPPIYQAGDTGTSRFRVAPEKRSPQLQRATTLATVSSPNVPGGSTNIQQHGLEYDQRSTVSPAPSEGSSTLPPSYSSHFRETWWN